VRKLLFNLHLYLALGAGVFIVVLGITGAIMAFEPEIGHLLHPTLSYVRPQPHKLSLAEIEAVVHQAYPDKRIFGYLLSTSPDISCAVSLRGRQVYVDQYTGAILGDRPSGMDFLAYVHQTHLRLAIRRPSDPGKTIMSWAGMLLLILLLSGLYLWWPVKRVSIRGSAATRRFWFDLHNSVGIFSMVFLLLLTLTGVMIGFEETTVPLMYKVTGSQPSEEPRTPPPPPPGGGSIPPDQAMAIARAAIPGAEPFQVNVPGPAEPYFVRSRFPEDLTPAGRSRVLIDPYTGKVLFAEGSRTAPPGTRMVNQNRAIHTGDIFGLPSKTVMSLASLAIVVQVLTGLVMWWKRRTAPQSRDR
jgi:uncharacterized iron-regulated membrane protein